MEDFQHVGYSKEVIEFVAVVYSFDLFEGLLAAGE